jgi:hypothetical protein
MEILFSYQQLLYTVTQIQRNSQSYISPLNDDILLHNVVSHSSLMTMWILFLSDGAMLIKAALFTSEIITVSTFSMFQSK